MAEFCKFCKLRISIKIIYYKTYAEHKFSWSSSTVDPYNAFLASIEVEWVF